MPRVTTIPATKNKFTALPTASIAKRRTAGYARVSTDKDEQFTSYEAQVDYYTKYIQSREDWEFVDGLHRRGHFGAEHQAQRWLQPHDTGCP